jgi:enoyl-CoA hydratase/carnithine racemase
MNRLMQTVTASLTQSVAPCVIAAVHGAAYGGGAELASSADLRVGSTGAKAAFVQSRMGLVTGWGGTRALAGAVTRPAALQLLLSAAPHSQTELLALGWLNDSPPLACETPPLESTPQMLSLPLSCQVSDTEWLDAVSRGSAPMLRSAGPTLSDGEIAATTGILRAARPAVVDMATLTPDALSLVRFASERFALPARSARLARAPKAMLNAANGEAALQMERQLFAGEGGFWRGVEHSAALCR